MEKISIKKESPDESKYLKLNFNTKKTEKYTLSENNSFNCPVCKKDYIYNPKNIEFTKNFKQIGLCLMCFEDLVSFNLDNHK